MVADIEMGIEGCGPLGHVHGEIDALKRPVSSLVKGLEGPAISASHIENNGLHGNMSAEKIDLKMGGESFVKCDALPVILLIVILGHLLPSF